MRLRSLSIENVRRIGSAQLSPGEAVNVVTGENGSGKTSLLESIHYLSTARSFRTTRVSDVITHGHHELLVTGDFVSSSGQRATIGVAKSPANTRIKMNGEMVTVASKVAQTIPLLTFDSETYQLLNGGPTNRRALLDRLLFHVEHRYFESLKIYYRALKQRNSLLRTRVRGLELRSFDEQLAHEAERIDVMRRRAVDNLNEIVAGKTKDLFASRVTFGYRRGWRNEESMAEALSRTIDRDKEMCTTSVGPHRAEIRINFGEKLAKSVVSRGQGKLIIGAIVSAQADYLRIYGDKSAIILVDDLASELDRRARANVVEALCATEAQLFFTAIDPADLPKDLIDMAELFHVEHGRINHLATA